MREIKFRAWHFILKRMFSAEEMANDQMTLLTTGYFINCHSDISKSEIAEHDVMIPLQFTGLKDKNGKEIYEGDIIFRESGYSHSTSAVVDWDEKSGSWNCYLGNRVWQDLLWRKIRDHEIIGNIYENSELLK